MKILYKLFRQDPDRRDSVIAVTSGLGIAANLLLAAVKIILGLWVSSIAIVSEGANNAADALSSVLTLIGTKLAGKRPDTKHPFGYRRIEYLTGLVIAVLISVTGIELLIGSIRRIFHPEDLHISYPAIAVIAVSALVKFFLGTYTVKMGKKAGSAALEAVGIEGRNDSFASLITILSSLLFLIGHVSVDAYAGLLISALILKAGVGVLRETLSELIGRSGQRELADKLYRVIRDTDGILAASDMILHNYGPDTWSGSVNVELDHKMTAGEIFPLLHALQVRIMKDYAVAMVFGIYAVDNNREDISTLREEIAAFVEGQPHVKSFHALYPDPQTGRIYCDLLVDHDLPDQEALEAAFAAYMARRHPRNELVVTIETEYV